MHILYLYFYISYHILALDLFFLYASNTFLAYLYKPLYFLRQIQIISKKITIKITTILALTLKSYFLGEIYYTICIFIVVWSSHVADCVLIEFKLFIPSILTAILLSVYFDKSWQFPNIEIFIDFYRGELDFIDNLAGD